MNKFISALLGIASLSFMFALAYENNTGLSVAYKSHSALLEQRIQIYSTFDKGFDQTQYDAQYNSIAQYSHNVDTEKAAYPSYRSRWSNVK